MAKQRPQSKPKKHPTSPSSRSGRVAATDMPVSSHAHTRRSLGSEMHHTPAAAPPAAPAPPVRRSTYFEAVAVYERGLEALQRHDYPAAIERLESVLRLYPDEKELH